MNTNVLLISPQDVRDMTNLSDNLDDCNIVPSIIDSQLIGLQSIIGTNLYDKLCKLVETGEIIDNLPYNNLLNNYIFNYLLNMVLADMVIYNYNKQHNVGNIQYIDNSYQHNSLSDLKYLQQYYTNKATFYAERLTDFLCKNITLYPEYKQCSDELNPSDIANTYKCGIKL